MIWVALLCFLCALGFITPAAIDVVKTRRRMKRLADLDRARFRSNHWLQTQKPHDHERTTT